LSATTGGARNSLITFKIKVVDAEPIILETVIRYVRKVVKIVGTPVIAPVTGLKVNPKGKLRGTLAYEQPVML
jgi:hypothetical protein